MYCDKCGQELREGARYCSKCGTKFENEDEFITQDNLNEAGKKESYDDRYENVQYDRNEPVSNQNRSRKNKLIVLFTIIGLTVAVAITAIILYVTLNSSTPAKNVYKKYLQVLENTKDNIVEFENDCGVNGVAFYDINHSGVSDVLYITKNDTTEANADRWYLHCLSDVEEDIKIDVEEDIPGGVQDWETLFITDKDNCIYVLNKNRLYSLVFEKDEVGKGKYRVEMLAQRVYDNAEEEYSCTLKSVSGEMKSISENEYNEYIDEICGRNLNILISTLKDEELEKVFPYIDKCFSVNSNDAIKRLKNGNVTVGGEDHHFAEILDKETKIIETKSPTTPPTDESSIDNETDSKADLNNNEDHSTFESWSNLYRDFILDQQYLSQNTGVSIHGSGGDFNVELEEYSDYEIVYFMLYDFDRDNTPELIAYSGYTAFSTPYMYVYTVKDNQMVYLDRLGLGELCYDPSSDYTGVFYSGGRQGGYFTCYTYYQDGRFNTKNVASDVVIDYNDWDKGFNTTIENQELYEAYLECTDPIPSSDAAYNRQGKYKIPHYNYSEINYMGWEEFLSKF